MCMHRESIQLSATINTSIKQISSTISEVEWGSIGVNPQSKPYPQSKVYPAGGDGQYISYDWH